MAGLAGAAVLRFRVWLVDWSIAASATAIDDTWAVEAADRQFGIRLSVTPQKPIVLNGDRGLSQKSAEPGNASYYYSIPRLRTTGSVTVDGTEIPVAGTSWLDREWGSSALARNQQGWDWFALQLSDGTDLMFYVLRQSDGSPDPQSAGTWVSADGNASHLTLDAVELVVTASG